MKNKDKIIEYFEKCPKGSVIVANDLYTSNFSKMSQGAFFKALERLTKQGLLSRVAKGMYAWSGQIDNEDVLNHFFGEENLDGMYIGSKLYVKYGLTACKDDEVWLYSTIMDKETCNIGNIHAKKVHIPLTYDNTRIIEALEIMQNYDEIPELNKNKFARYAKQFSKNYNDEAAVYVLNNMRYKKKTIAFMKKILDMYKIPNSLQNFLSCTSKYKVPPVIRVAR